MSRFHTFETIINMQPNTKTMNLKSILMNFSKHFNHKKKKNGRILCAANDLTSLQLGII